MNIKTLISQRLSQPRSNKNITRKSKVPTTKLLSWFRDSQYRPIPQRLKIIRGEFSPLSGHSASSIIEMADNIYLDWQISHADSIPPVVPITEHITQIMILKSMVAAAYTEGKLSGDKVLTIGQVMNELGINASFRPRLHYELEHPEDASAIARLAKDCQQAARIYLASLIVTLTRTNAEETYLQNLARLLNLDPQLKNRLEQQFLS